MLVVEGKENDCGALGGGSRKTQTMTSIPAQVATDWNSEEIQGVSKISNSNPERPGASYNRLRPILEEPI